MEEKNDEQLVDDFIGGDEKALAILVSKYLKPIFNFVYHYTNDVAIAEDITQEVFIKVWKKIKKFDRGKKFKTWIFAIAKNTTIDYLRKKKIFLPLSYFIDEGGDNMIAENMNDPAPWPDEIFDRRDLAERLVLSMDKISFSTRQMIFLYHYDQFNFQEIADLLDESVNTIKSRYRRAMLFLRDNLDISDFK